MTDRLFLAAADLPPRPDPTTGEPRPPRAPGLLRPERSAKEQQRARVADPSKAPAPPDGEGPLLAWFKSSRREALLITVTGIPLFPLGVTIIQGFSIEWMKYWLPWVVMIPFLLAIYSVQRTVECSVGAEWLKVGKTWVRLYELTKITAKHRSSAIHIDFQDRAGREVMVQASDLQNDRDMWDLVYNGILHSVIVGGAKTNGLLHSSLRVPRPENRSE